MRVTHLKGDGSAERNLARLDRDRPDIAARVRRGDLSANAGAIEAGFRKRSLTVPGNSAAAAIRVLLKHFSRADLLAALHE